MKKSELDFLLYAVTDFPSYPQHDPLASVRQALEGGASIIQLREKYKTTPEIVALAKQIIPLCREFNACFIVNDDVDAALLSGADGVHVGQHDLSLAEVRRKLGPDKIIGVSAQTVEQARSAIDGGADYLGVGAVFPTTTKHDADAVSYDTLKAICGISSVPVVAIGGITLENVARLEGSGIDGVAVVSAIFAQNDVTAAARALRARSAALFAR